MATHLPTTAPTANKVYIYNSHDAIAFITRELSGLDSGKSNASSSSVFIVCPFHDDTDPSCGVNLDDSSGVPLGFFHCFACGAKGGWNTLAAKLNIKTVENWYGENTVSRKKTIRKYLNPQGQTDPSDPLNSTHRALSILQQMGMVNSTSSDETLACDIGDPVQNPVVKTMLASMRLKQVSPWPIYMAWRGYEGSFLKAMGCLISDTMELIFPVTTHGKLVGLIKAYNQKVPGKPSYINCPGTWVKSHGLLFYDNAKAIISKQGSTSLYVVEGPRDALRFYVQEPPRPSVAFLGAKATSIQKLELLFLLPIKRIVVVPDNDHGGKEFKCGFEQAVEDYKHSYGDYSVPVDIVYLRLPRKLDFNGKAQKLDPHSLDQADFDKLLTL